MPCVYRKEYFPPALSSHRRVRLNMSYRIQNTEYRILRGYDSKKIAGKF